MPRQGHADGAVRIVRHERDGATVIAIDAVAVKVRKIAYAVTADRALRELKAIRQFLQRSGRVKNMIQFFVKNGQFHEIGLTSSGRSL